MHRWDKDCQDFGPPGEEYEILKALKNAVPKKSSENNEEPHKPHINTIIRPLKKKNDVEFA